MLLCRCVGVVDSVLGLLCVAVLLLLCVVDERVLLVLGLILLWAEIVRHSVEHVLLDLENCVQSGKSEGEEAITAVVAGRGLVVLFGPGAIDVVAALASYLKGVEGVALGGIDECLGVLLDDGECLVELAQTLVTQRVGLLGIWLDVSVRTLEVVLDGLSKAVVGGVGSLECLCTVGVGLDGVN